MTIIRYKIIAHYKLYRKFLTSYSCEFGQQTALSWAKQAGRATHLANADILLVASGKERDIVLNNFTEERRIQNARHHNVLIRTGVRSNAGSTSTPPVASQEQPSGLTN